MHNFEIAQYTTLLRLVRELRAAYPAITRQHVVGHSDVECVSSAGLTIGRDRPEDPGEAFDWDRFEAANQARTRTTGPPAPTVYNIGPGQTVEVSGRRTPPTLAPDYAALQADLAAIGYSIASDGVTASGAWDRATQQAVNRFQRRYFSGGHRTLRPAGFVIGTLDYTTAAAIASVAGDTGP